MAATIDSAPADVVAVGNCIRYGVSLSDGGTAPEVKSTGYQLFVEGAAIMAKIRQIPYTGATEYLDFSKVLRSQVRTTPQQPGAVVSNVEDADFEKEFYLRYGEVVFNSDTCDTNLSGVSTNDTTKKVANIAFQWFQDQGDLAAGVIPCTNRPATNYVCRDQSDWLWLYKGSAGNYAVIFRVNYNDGTSDAISVEVSPGAKIFSIGPGNFFDPFLIVAGKKWVWYEIEVYSDLATTLVKSFRFNVVDCCSGSFPDELYWLEPMGGYAGMKFDTVRVGNGITSRVYDQGVDCSASTVEGLGVNGGKTKGFVSSVRTVSLQKTIPYTEGIELFLEGLISSKSHFVNQPGPSGEVLAKFILSDGSYTVSDNGNSISLSVSGEIHIDFNVL